MLAHVSSARDVPDAQLSSFSAWLHVAGATTVLGGIHSSSFCFLISSECVLLLLRRKESRKTVEGYTSSLQHLQMSAGHWELHLLPLRLAGRKERRSDEGEEREIKLEKVK